MRNALSAVDYAFKTAFWHDNEEKQKEAEREYKNTFRTDMSTPKVENLPYTTSEAPKITYLGSSKTTPSVSYEGTNKSKDEWHIDMSPKAQAERSARNIRESAERRNPDNGWLQEKADHEKNRAVQSARIKAQENMDYYKYGRHEITDPPSYNPNENMAEIIVASGVPATSEQALDRYLNLDTQYTPRGEYSKAFIELLNKQKMEASTAIQNLKDTFDKYFDEEALKNIAKTGAVQLEFENLVNDSSVTYKEAETKEKNIFSALTAYNESAGPLMILENDFINGSITDMPSIARQELLPYYIEGRGTIPYSIFKDIVNKYMVNIDEEYCKKAFEVTNKEYRLAVGGATFSKLDAEAVGQEKDIETDLEVASGKNDNKSNRSDAMKKIIYSLIICIMLGGIAFSVDMAYEIRWLPGFSITLPDKNEVYTRENVTYTQRKAMDKSDIYITVLDDENGISFSFSTPRYGRKKYEFESYEEAKQSAVSIVSAIEESEGTVFQKDVLTIGDQYLAQVYYKESFEEKYILHFETNYNDSLLCFDFSSENPLENEQITAISDFLKGNVKFDLPEEYAKKLAETEAWLDRNMQTRKISNIIALIVVPTVAIVSTIFMVRSVRKKRKIRERDAIRSASVTRTCRACGEPISESSEICPSCGTRQ